VIDLHSHVLAGLDDGAVDLAASVEIARAAVADGTTVLAATPHVREDYPTTPQQLRRGLEELRRRLDEERIDLRIVPGGEIAIEEARTRPLDELRPFGLGGNPAYLLLETPVFDWPLAFGDVVLGLVARGVTPVIGHPERNVVVQRDVEPLAQLVRAGALSQVTAASIDGRLGTKARKCARRLIAADLAHLIGSDAHMPAVRAVGLSAARAALDDEPVARWLTESMPAAILNDEPLPERPRARRRRAFFARRSRP
jgi:protein-tyrosine phosphatase